ncbi:LysR substrate-binding domain-containing protein [Pseudodonghicola flavimaris]|uniref:LysR substrate-binding domain-containing protein n=1 Tax=Pseudodonghicola flavimaris TaxID=3050036 RepID=A0ABT7EUN3_9RHOB|nr:LysR substrate-binding domain-containing protein [Pseudodonghicola flavimaris]MDK3016047.1 LysR substrate-binding domain-containing protein [Pseudodonghicola flavimaris]
MRYVQLRAFHYVAICGGFSRAAEALFLTQPAISDQVRKLEEEYDILLFNRRNKQVTLTREGEELLSITRRMFDVEQQALELLTESRALRSGELRIVADAAHHLVPVLGRFREKYPGVRITLRSGNTQSVLDGLHAYEADLGVLGEMPRGRDFVTLKLNSTPIIAFAHRDHPAATAGRLSLEELTRFPLVLREKGSKTRHRLEELAAAEGLTLSPTIEAEGREAVREIVASGAGVGFVSIAEFGADSRFTPIEIAAPPMLMDEALICLRERAGAKLVRAFFEIARGLADDPAP